MSRNMLRNRWQQLTESEVRRLQVAQLRQYLGNVVLPFSAHYRELFRRLGLEVESIRSLDDLQRLPFTTKADLLNTAEQPQKVVLHLAVPQLHGAGHARPSRSALSLSRIRGQSPGFRPHSTGHEVGETGEI